MKLRFHGAVQNSMNDEKNAVISNLIENSLDEHWHRVDLFPLDS